MYVLSQRLHVFGAQPAELQLRYILKSLHEFGQLILNVDRITTK